MSKKLIIATLAAVTLAACGGQEATDNADAKAADSKATQKTAEVTESKAAPKSQFETKFDCEGTLKPLAIKVLGAEDIKLQIKKTTTDTSCSWESAAGTHSLSIGATPAVKFLTEKQTENFDQIKKEGAAAYTKSSGIPALDALLKAEVVWYEKKTQTPELTPESACKIITEGIATATGDPSATTITVNTPRNKHVGMTPTSVRGCTHNNYFTVFYTDRTGKTQNFPADKPIGASGMTNQQLFDEYVTILSAKK